MALYVLDRYEIENYLLSPKLIFRAINRFKDYSHITSADAIEEKLQLFLEETIKLRAYRYDDTLEDNIYKTAAVLGKDEYRNQQITKSAANKICALYESANSFADLVVNGMGKEALNRLMSWINEDLKIKFNYTDVLGVIEAGDIPQEISDLLTGLRSKESKTANTDNKVVVASKNIVASASDSETEPVSKAELAKNAKPVVEPKSTVAPKPKAAAKAKAAE